MTYSIVARDPAAGLLGAAVQSAWYGSATAVLLVEAGVGAAVTQAMGERAFAFRGLEMVAAGSTPADAVTAVMERETTAALSQVGMIDIASIPAAFTGSACIPHAGHHVSVDCAAQANMMVAPGVPEAMVKGFETGNRDLAERMLDALDAAQALGGDFRGMQSAGLIVRSAERDAPLWSASVVDVRVDDHPDPLRELRRLVALNQLYGTMSEPFRYLSVGDVDGAVAAARKLFDAAPADPNVKMRLGVALVAAGDPEGNEILSSLAATNGQWVDYARRSLQRYGIDPGRLFP